MEFTFDHAGIVVSNIDRSIQFYRDILGLKVINPVWLADVEGTGILVGRPGTRMKVAKLGFNENSCLELQQFLFPEGKQARETKLWDVSSAHISFTVGDMSKAYDELKGKGVRFVNPPAKNSLGILAAYFYDPDGITLAITERSKR